ncbi:unnamed protein product [Acanthoscelides obtectus]|uniref:Invertebrate defensins family profile domain-containing protein n=1 Tax=Acanthoscelides obtectus TaxID=200917 RepID=A0A9P0JWZ7_ACAOB|nr:unnamed protein product [Acanthoscelides obtectus]CAK1663466.1 hypothetical protein AOBTE_LOCUS23684 [Acanthoscelides obtectus]
MKCFAIFICLVVVFASVMSAPLEVPEEELEHHEEVAHLRVRRATCDIIGSISVKGVKLNDAACALHCIQMGGGRTGGYCDGRKVCHCR